MKKLLTLLFVAVAAIAAHATDYDVPVTVTVNDVVTEQKGIISVVEHDGLYDLTVKNFILQNAENPMYVGNVEVKDIIPYQDGNTTLLVSNQSVQIVDGDDPTIPFWAGPFLPPIPMELRGKIQNGELRCYLDIDMRESIQEFIKVSIGGGYQMPNQSFENWHTSTGKNVEPNRWHSFESATGNLAAMATMFGTHIAKSTDAHSGELSARIFAFSIFGTLANGTMTTGRMNAGSMSASDVANNAYTDMSSTDVDGNGDPFYLPLVSRPDSIVAWVKFQQGKANEDHPYATISAVITDDTRYQDPEDKTYTNVVAKAKNNTIATTNGQWVRVSAPFVYEENNVNPEAILITVSTNADPGQGSDKDSVLVDDIALIYNAQATGITVKGRAIADFSSDKTEYDIEVNGNITADDIQVTTNGKAAHVVKTIEDIDDITFAYITIIGGDMETTTNYTINIKETPLLLGDANGDGTVDMKDATSIMNYLLGTPDKYFNAEAADANGDKEINMPDIMFIVNYVINGKFPEE